MNAINKLNQVIYTLPTAETVLLVANTSTDTAIALVTDTRYKFPELPCPTSINDVVRYARYWGYKGIATVVSVLDDTVAINEVEV